jgi:hypothetical protein
MASEFTTKIDTAQNVTFTTGMLPGIGREPKVLAVIYNATTTNIRCDKRSKWHFYG